ncbi:MAG TPA: Wzz/FepE/Etk N-terminal domain-containing protein, partial [Pyrinomonadaceae bacterium]
MMSEDNRLLPVTTIDRALDRPLSDLAASAKGGYGASSNDPTHLRDYLNVVLKRKWLILSLVLVVTTLVTIQMYRMPTVFEAETTLQIDPKRESILARKDQIVINTGRGGGDAVYAQTQLRLLENRALARQVIRTLDLQNNPAFLGDQAQASFVSSLRRIFLREKKGTRSTAEDQSMGTIPEVTWENSRDEKLTAEELRRFEPYEDTLAANLKVEPETGTNLVKLRYRHTDPEMAQKIVNTLANIFAYNNFDRETSGSDRNTRVLAEKIAELQLKITQLEERKYNYAKANNLPFDTKQGSDLEAERLAILSRQVLEAENLLKEAETQWNEAKKGDPQTIPQVQDNQRVQKLRNQLDELEQQKAELMEVYTEEHPQVKKLDKKITALSASMKKAPTDIVSSLEKRYRAAQEKVSKLKTDYFRQKGTTTTQSLAMIQYGTILQDLETNKQDLNVLRQRLREIENVNVDRINNVSVTTYSRRGNPVGPPRVRNIMLALLLSLGAGVGLAFLLDYLDDTLKSVDDVDRYLHLPSLALIPATRGESRSRLKSGGPAPAEGEVTALALTTDVSSPVAEAYRHLRTSLL